MTLGELMQALETRAKDHRDWLLEQRPQVFDEQKHCEDGTIERVYWHYGYMVAVRDVLRQLQSLQKENCAMSSEREAREPEVSAREAASYALSERLEGMEEAAKMIEGSMKGCRLSNSIFTDMAIKDELITQAAAIRQKAKELRERGEIANG